MGGNCNIIKAVERRLMCSVFKLPLRANISGQYLFLRWAFDLNVVLLPRF